jgi:hypothetical protein
MTAFTPEGFVKEQHFVDETIKPNRTLWVSEAAGLTQLGALVEILRGNSAARNMLVNQTLALCGGRNGLCVGGQLTLV